MKKHFKVPGKTITTNLELMHLGGGTRRTFLLRDQLKQRYTISVYSLYSSSIGFSKLYELNEFLKMK